MRCPTAARLTYMHRLHTMTGGNDAWDDPSRRAFDRRNRSARRAGVDGVSRKYSEARKAAFLAALSVSGNQTLSAERVKVSRSWVCLQRRTDADFDRSVRDAIASARVGLSLSEGSSGAADRFVRRGGNRPPRGWGGADGLELVVTGSNGRRVQVRRAKCGGWTRSIEERFLIALSQTCNVKMAAAAAGMSKSSAYAHRHRWPAFAAEWDEAVSIGYAAVEMALIEGANDFFERRPMELGDAPAIVTSVGEALQVLAMNRFAVTGIPKRGA